MTINADRRAVLFERAKLMLTERRSFLDGWAEDFAELRVEFRQAAADPVTPEDFAAIVALARKAALDSAKRAKAEAKAARQAELQDQLRLDV